MAKRVGVEESLQTSDVIEAELNRLRQRRREVYAIEDDPGEVAIAGGVDADRRQTLARLAALDEHLVGMSFSGGGIRAGTFAIGFAQGLSSLGLLRRVDYLSTVSGGGYAGSWLAAWLKREGAVANVEKQLDASNVEQAYADRELLPPFADGDGRERRRVVDEEPEPIRHLREYSSYLTPRSGLLTIDTWTVIAIWARNVAINLMMLVPLAVLLVLLARLVVYLYGYVSPASIAGDGAPPWLIWAFFLPGLALLAVGFGSNALSLGEFRTGGHDERDYRTGDPGKRRHFMERWSFKYFTVYPLIGAAVLLTVPIRGIIWWLGERTATATGGAHRPGNWLVNFLSDYASVNLGLLGVPNFAGHAVVLGAAMAACALYVNARNRTLVTRDSRGARVVHWKFPIAAGLAGATAGVLFPLLEWLIRRLNDAELPGLAATIVPPLVLLIAVVAIVVEVALVGREITEAEREWWARLSAAFLIAALAWVAAMGTMVFGPAAFLASGPWLRVALTSGWLGATAFGVLSGRYALPSKPGGGSPLATIATLVPPIFLAGLLGGLSLLVAFLINIPPLNGPIPADQWSRVDLYYRGIVQTSLWPVLAWMIAAGAAAALASRLIDVNLFSLNAMYANRLIRCYLGASRPKAVWEARWGGDHDPRAGGGAPSLSVRGEPPRPVPPARDPNPVTGFDLRDDIPLFDLRIGPDGGGDRPFWGPHLLINATLNLVAGTELAWRDRKGESFVMTPLHCGSKGVGFAELTPETRENLTLGRAITISGAAVDPNMKFYQSAALTAFLTIFNARLGYWMQNPLFQGWKAEGPKFGDRLIDEFFGHTDGKQEFVHLSDGGHFENLGAYELIRRRCRYIVVVDSGEDADASDDNLADLIRLCRIDFGVRIQLDTAPLLEEGPDRLARTHVVIGRVRYDDVDNGQLPGIIVYVKISMTGDEPSDVQKYAKKAPQFPHQPTDLRQDFDEEQFECYRALGDHVARSVFADAVNKVRDDSWMAPATWDDYIRGNRRFFSALRARWADTPAGQDERFVQSARQWTQLHRDLRNDPALGDFSRDLYPELPPAPPAGPGPGPPSGPVDRPRAELHTVGQMLQIMEDAWINLGLKGHHDLPMNRGWMNAFRRWSGADAFRRLWPTLRPEFSPDFVDFCETQLHLAPADPPKQVRLAADPAADPFVAASVRAMTEEFRREWPGEAWPDPPKPCRGIDEMIAQARALHGRLANPPGPPVWLIVQAPSGELAAVDSPDKFACGIILARDYLEEATDPATGAVAYVPLPGIFELFAWVRRPHRSTGLGSRCLKSILDEVKAELRAAHPEVADLRLRVRYPKSGQMGDTDLEREMWLNFFALYDFRPIVPPKGANRKETVLEHRL